MRAAAAVGAVATIAITIAACAAGTLAATRIEAEPWPAADALFRSDPRWLGGDAAYSVALDGERVLWLFGDSFVARDDDRDRRRSTMVRNSIAVQRGRDPARASMAFAWRTNERGEPAPYFADAGAHGIWPLHGVRIDGGPLLLFQTLVRNTPGEGLGFAIDGWRLVRIDDVADDPRSWQLRDVVCAPLAEGITVGAAAWCDGDHVHALGTRFDGFVHRGVLCRFAIADLEGGDGNRVTLQWWNGAAWSADAPPAPAVVLDDAGPECSVHHDGERWLHAWSRGFGATTVAVHDAAAATGPWSAAIDAFTPPQSRGRAPFVYAAKLHPELDAGSGWLAVTYATNSFAFADLFTPAGQAELYWPRCWRIRVR